jgi:threonine/homoserine/homoserine lactone efflux protein
MMIKWIVNACPFAPGVAKPASMRGPSLPKISLWNKMVNRKTIILVLSFVSLTLLYSYNYPALNYSGKSLLFEDMFFIKLSLYTYITSMVGYYIREYKRKQRQG